MEHSVEIKVCGLTREEDVDFAREMGADYFGFIVYPVSPRGLAVKRAAELAARVPAECRVAVDVEIDPAKMEALKNAGFDLFQIHTDPHGSGGTPATWSAIAGRRHLWLAPRLAPDQDLPGPLLEFADTVLVDTYDKNKIGGTGRTGDWKRFRELKAKHPDITWVLAGGLTPENAAEALAATGAARIDVNSGVESAPGVKDPDKLKQLWRTLRPE